MIAVSTASREENIRQLVEAGFALMPLLAGTKTPYLESWTSFKPDPLQIPADFPDNYGIILRDDVLVIDVDIKNFAAGDNPYLRLLNDLGVPPGEMFDTFTVRSKKGHPQDGLHIYFRKPTGVNLQTHRKDLYGKGIEVKTVGAFLVGPGSIHPDTKKPYEVINGDPHQLMDVPQKILELFQRNVTKTAAGVDGYVDDEPTRNRYIEYLMNREPAVEGMGGDSWTLKTAMAGRDFGLPEQATFDLMAACWNDRCSPPWDLKELAAKVHNAYMYARDAAGNRHVQSAFTKIDIIPPVSEKTKLEKEHDQWKADKATAESSVHPKIDWQGKYANGVLTELNNTIDNVKNHLRLPSYGEFKSPFHNLLRVNRFSHQVEFVRMAPWHHDKVHYLRDIDITQMRAWFSNRHKWNPPKDVVYEGVMSYAEDNAYHPVKEYFSSLKWDGVPRLSSLFSRYAGAEDNEYTRAVSRCFMVGMVSRIMVPGCKFDNVVVLEGEQGTGKSTFCKVLGQDWHTELHLDPHNKDTVVGLLGKMIIELSEMTHAKKSEADAVKAFISKQVDNIRKPYGRINEDIPRQCVFIGTINPDGTRAYLRDQTGNRRFWPIETGVIDNAQLGIDRDQLFAEAYNAWLNGELNYINDPKVLQMAEVHQQERTERDPWADIISAYLKREENQGRYYARLSTNRIAEDVLNIPAKNVDRLVLLRVSNAMASLGWRASRITEDGMRKRGYRNPDFTQSLDEIVNGV